MMQFTFRLDRCSYIVAVGVTLIGLATAVLPATAQTIRTVALSGQQAPGTPSGVRFSSNSFSFETPVLNAAGHTAFVATTTANRKGIWSEGSGSLALVASQGSQALGTADGVHYDFFNPPVLNAAGQTAFVTSLTGSGVTSANNQGIWSEGSGSLALVARAGRQAADLPSGVNYSGFSFSSGSVALNAAGQTAFIAFLTGSGVTSANRKGIWSERSGSLALVVREGNQAPGTPSGVNYRLVSSPVRMNAAGQIAFTADLTGSGVTTVNDEGIWSEGSGSLTLVAREGNQAPGTSSGVNYGFLTAPALNSAGQTAFYGALTGSGVTTANGGGIWSEGSGSLALVARQGDQAPGTPSGVTYRFFNPPALNAAGQTAFEALLTGSGVESVNDQGIWSEGSGSLALVARTGNQAPGTPSGVIYSNFDPLVLNAAGQTAFSARIGGIGVLNLSDFGIWATDSSGQPQLIAREGNLLEVAPGDFRTISRLSFVDNLGGPCFGFNDLGQVAFSATFTDGSSGVFVSNLVAIPEPSTLTLLLIVVVGKGVKWGGKRYRDKVSGS